MLAVFCVFAGQFAFFTYMRPFHETVSGFDVGRLSTVLLGFGIANFAGTTFAAPVLLRAHLRLTLALAPAVLAACAAGLVLLGGSPVWAAALTVAWGFTFGTVPVGWSTWVTRNVPDDAESAGGLQVATIQVANTVGAGLGGFVLDVGGATAPVAAAGTLLGLTCLIVLAGLRAQVRSSA
jgi:predicted MFS family arabinose efflux permease